VPLGIATLIGHLNPNCPTAADTGFPRMRVLGRQLRPLRAPAPGAAREPGTGDRSGDLYPDVLASLRHLAEIIDQGWSSVRLVVSKASPWSSEDRI
jgi:hypothetical protein